MEVAREKVLEVKDLKKRYGSLQAVDGISFYVERGEVFTLLGPNGAGKTTTVEILEGLKTADSGEIIMLGRNCKVVDRALKERLGVLLQETRYMDKIKVLEMAQMFASFYRKPLPPRDIIAKVALEEKMQAFVEDLSGGQRQRLAIGLSLINDPDIIFMDEPTTGLDPQARRNIWDLIEELKEENKTIFLTTHYMEEAERLSDYVFIMDHGNIIAQGTPQSLIADLGKENIIEFAQGGISEEALEHIQGMFPKVTLQDEKVHIHTEQLTPDLSRLLNWSREQDLEFENLMFRRPNLEDVFLSLTGKGLRD